MKKIKGTYTAIVTPFKKNGDVDVPALEKLVDWQIKCGINGLVPCGSTGEAATLDLKDYKKVLETVVKKTASRVPVIAGATHNNTELAVEYSKIAKNAGANALLHATPYYNKPPLAGLIAHYKKITSSVDLPIVLYNVPSRTAMNQTAEMTLAITKKIPNIIGIKEASGDLRQIKEIINKAPKNFSTLSGDDALVYKIIEMGGDGIICTTSNEIPGEFTQLVEFALNGEFKKALKIYDKYLPLMNANFIESNPIPVKTALAIMGRLKEANFRLPLVQMGEENKKKLIKVLKECDLI